MAGLYIHIPFCKSRCTYCDFTSYPKKLSQAEGYAACLYKEIKLRGYEFKNKKFDTVYIGGGTPSAIDAKLISGGVKQLKNCFKIAENAEITIEINPGTADFDKIAAYKDCGINRFSVGLQSAQERHLNRLNRAHDAEDFKDVCKLLEGENFSADILVGIAEQTKEDLKETIKLAEECGASHISMYALKPEEGTPLYSDYLNGFLPTEDEVAELYDYGVKLLKESGFDRYEVSNFCKNGRYSKHNLNYWNRGEYLGFGLSACSFMDGVRFTNTADFDDYFKCIISNRYPVVDSEEVSGEEAEFEFIMLSLRTVFGLDVKKFKKIFKTDFFDKYKKPLKAKESFLDISDGCIKIKPEYLFVQNSIIIEFLN